MRTLPVFVLLFALLIVACSDESEQPEDDTPSPSETADEVRFDTDAFDLVELLHDVFGEAYVGNQLTPTETHTELRIAIRTNGADIHDLVDGCEELSARLIDLPASAVAGPVHVTLVEPVEGELETRVVNQGLVVPTEAGACNAQ